MWIKRIKWNKPELKIHEITTGKRVTLTEWKRLMKKFPNLMNKLQKIYEVNI